VIRPAHVALLVALAACGTDPAALSEPDAGPGADAPGTDAPGAGADDGIAPPGIYPDEAALADGDTAVDVAANATATFRIDAEPDQHVGVHLTFASQPGVVMAVERWDGAAPSPIGQTDAGNGRRVLAVRDAEARRTYWVRVTAGPAPLAGTLAVTRTAFEDGAACASDCARLLQLPLPNDPAHDGYATDGSTVFRYWFGRRDLVMFVRAAGRTQATAGREPFVPQDLSQWDGATPGTDVGAPRHASHQRGKDVDLSVYGTDGLAPWRSYCTTTTISGGRECVAGSARGFDGQATAIAVSALFATGRVTMSFLDRELIDQLVPGAEAAAAGGTLAPALVPLYGDGQHVQHWPNHDNHIHIRVSEATAARPAPGAVAPFEAP